MQAKVTYNADGTVATATDPGNGTNSTTYSYNATTHQLTGVTPPTGTTLGGRSFSSDLFGRLGTSTSGRGITTTYGYDKLDRLISVTYSDGTPPVTYTYDTTGRLHTRVDTTGTTTWDYDPRQRCPVGSQATVTPAKPWPAARAAAQPRAAPRSQARHRNALPASTFES